MARTRLAASAGCHRLRSAALVLALAGPCWVLAQGAAPAAKGLEPVITQAQGGQCVGEPAFMRRNHMKLLKHQRDDTMHGGVRTGAYSLKECVACHASPTSRSVTAQPGDFCRSCHDYAAVKIDCFECHANQAAAGSGHASAAVAAPAAGLLAQAQAMLPARKAQP